MRYSVIYTDVCKEWRRKPRADKMQAKLKIFFALQYNELIEEQRLNNTQAGVHNDNNAAKQQQYFASALDNLELAELSDKYEIAHLIAPKKTLTDFNKSITNTIASLLQHG